MLRRVAAAVGLVALSFSLAPGAGAQDSVEATYSNYHRAIRAYELCNNRRFDQAEHEKFSTYIDQRIDDSISVGRRLSLIQQAKIEIRDLIDKKGCDSSEVQDALSLFSSELQPVLMQ